jgi:WD40 repeat protein
MIISPDGQTSFISYSLDNRFRVGKLRTDQTYRIQMKHLSTGQTVGTLEGRGDQVAIAVSPDGETLAVTTREDGIEVWDLTTQRSRRFEHHFEQKSWFLSFVKFSPDGERIISAAKDAINVWQRHTGKLLHSMPAHKYHHAPSASFSPNGQFAVTGSANGTIQVWGFL